MRPRASDGPHRGAGGDQQRGGGDGAGNDARLLHDHRQHPAQAFHQVGGFSKMQKKCHFVQLDFFNM